MNSTAHTPTPWRVEDDGETVVIIGRPTWKCRRHGKIGEWGVAAVDDLLGDHAEEQRANADFIVRAVNSHDDMLAALKKAEQFIANGVELGFIRMPDASTPDPAHDTLPAIRAAIARATGAP